MREEPISVTIHFDTVVFLKTLFLSLSMQSGRANEERHRWSFFDHFLARSGHILCKIAEGENIDYLQ